MERMVDRLVEIFFFILTFFIVPKLYSNCKKIIIKIEILKIFTYYITFYKITYNFKNILPYNKPFLNEMTSTMTSTSADIQFDSIT